MSASNYVHLDVDCIPRVTEKAFLLRIGEDEVWVPRSCVADADSYEEGDTDCTVSVSEWFARKEGLLP